MNDEFENVTVEATENVDAQTTKENEESIELTDTANVEETADVETPNTEEKEEDSKPQGRYVTDEELNEIVDRRVARKMSKKEREYESKLAQYQDIENVLNAGLGTTSIQEATDKVRESYAEQGIKLPDKVISTYSQHDTELLARAEADEIIEDGYDAMVEEANRLANIGYENLNTKEKMVFTRLAEKLTDEKDKQELLSLGAKEGLLKDKEFNDFRKKFASNVPIKDVYELYLKIQPKSNIEKIGSMKNTKETGKKTYYTDDEISKLTSEELDDPEVWEAVRKSMTSQR